MSTYSNFDVSQIVETSTIKIGGIIANIHVRCGKCDKLFILSEHDRNTLGPHICKKCCHGHSRILTK